MVSACWQARFKVQSSLLHSQIIFICNKEELCTLQQACWYADIIVGPRHDLQICRESPIPEIKMSPPCTCTVTHSIGSLEGQDARLSSMGPWVCMSLSPYFLLWQQFYQTGSEGKPATRTKALPFYRFDFSNCAAVGDFGFLFAKKCCHQDRKWEKNL